MINSRVEAQIVVSERANLNKTIIGKNVWVGQCSKTITRLKMGDGWIMGLSFVVAQDLESFSIYEGVPINKIADLFTQSVLSIYYNNS